MPLNAFATVLPGSLETTDFMGMVNSEDFDLTDLAILDLPEVQGRTD